MLSKSPKSLKEFLKKNKLSTAVVSINDLREKEYSGVSLSSEEMNALANYEHFRIAELSKHTEDDKFNDTYQLLQVMANLRPWEDFLDARYQAK